MVVEYVQAAMVNKSALGRTQLGVPYSHGSGPLEISRLDVYRLFGNNTVVLHLRGGCPAVVETEHVFRTLILHYLCYRVKQEVGAEWLDIENEAKLVAFGAFAQIFVISVQHATYITFGEKPCSPRKIYL